MKQTPPLVSIIVPVYKVEKYLPTCIDSILAQTYKNTEIILVDDGSPDNSGIICDVYSHKYNNISVIHQTNAGLSAARNNGIKKATGDFIMFVDSDDELENSQLISNNISLFDSTTDIVQFPIKKLYVNENRTEILCSHEGKIEKEGDFLKNILPLYKQNLINGSACNKIFRRRIFTQVLFRTGILHEDSVFMLDLCNQFYNIKFSKIGYYKYFIRGGSINTSKHSFKWYFDYLNMQLYYYNRSSEYAELKDIKINNYICIINTIRTAYKDLSQSELNDVIKLTKNTAPSTKDLLAFFKSNSFQGLKITLAKYFGIKFLIKTLLIFNKI